MPYFNYCHHGTVYTMWLDRTCIVGLLSTMYNLQEWSRTPVENDPVVLFRSQHCQSRTMMVLLPNQQSERLTNDTYGPTGGLGPTVMAGRKAYAQPWYDLSMYNTPVMSHVDRSGFMI